MNFFTGSLSSMSFPIHSYRDALTTMADGTIKQLNPFSGTEVWTVPGRGNRPLSQPSGEPQPLDAEALTHTCNFCAAHQLRTPPEKSRMVRMGEEWKILRNLMPDQLEATQAEFRRVPNLFEIVSYDYWSKNYGYQMSDAQQWHMRQYLEDAEAREHILAIAKLRLEAGGHKNYTQDDLYKVVPSYFGGGHDVIIARRHFVDDARYDNQLASSGTLSVDEHGAFIGFTVDALRDLVEKNPYSPYVVVFQNWLAPAGASFDHLHKQLVTVDERGVQADMEIAKLRQNLNMYNEWGVNYAFYHNLVVAENDMAIAVAGIGHRYPTVSIYSKSATCAPWQQDPAEVRGMSDLVHAIHAAMGPEVACNEEWHYQPLDLDLPMPWRINIKWRISTLAGFEGGTKIYVNTLSPFDVRDKMVDRLYQLRDEGKIAGTINIATECAPSRNSLLYNPVLG